MHAVKSFYYGIINVGGFLQHFLLLILRLYWGLAFFQAGWGKLTRIEPVINFFTELGIPFPAFNAHLVGTVETVGGLCLLFGFASRLIAIPLIITMVTALVTAHGDATFGMFSALLEIHQNFDGFMQKAGTFVDQAPFNYLLTALIVFCFGPGAISVDGILGKIFCRKAG